MPAYRLTKDAEDDLIAIWRYTLETWGEKQADRYLDDLAKACDQIGLADVVAHEMPTIHPELRFIHRGRHYLFWLVDSPPVVIAFLHDQMNLVRHLKQRLQ